MKKSRIGQAPADGVRESRRALLPPPPPAPWEPAAVPILSDRLDAVCRSARGLIAEFRELAWDAREAEPSPLFESMFLGSLSNIAAELARLRNESGPA